MLITGTLPAELAVSVTAIVGSSDDTVRISLESARTTVPCPGCGGGATRVHSRYSRTLTDLPWQGLAVRLSVQVRRFFCEVVACPRRIFGERLPGLVKPYGQRSERLTTLFTAIGVALGGEAGARLVADLGLTTSPDTLLRDIRAMSLPIATTPRVLGVDDWARKRGHTYGTVLVDQEQHGIVGLLPDRTAETLAQWLKAHPGVEIVTRDRASAYADGSRQGAPEAVQIADRWHLLKNVGDALERVLVGRRTELRQATRARSEGGAEAAKPSLSSEVDVPTAELDPIAGSTQPQADQVAGRPPATALRPNAPAPTEPQPAKSAGALRLQARYADVLALHAQGRTIRAISRQTDLSRVTIRKYLRATSCPERSTRSTMLASLSAHETYLRERWDAGCHNAATLWQELRARGFAGSAGTVRRFVGAWRPTPTRRGRPPQSEAAPSHADHPAPMATPTPRRVKWWLLQSPAEVTPQQQHYLELLCAACPIVASAQQLAQEFGRLVRARDAKALTPWLAEAAASDLPEFRELAAGVRRDLAAVTAALTYDWSNGRTEGQVTRIKLIKRMMYGRGTLELLQRRLIGTA